MKPRALLSFLCFATIVLGAIGDSFGYYNPSSGRWLSKDPAAEDGGLNLYSFVANNPINLVDPFGLKPVDVLFGAFIPSSVGKPASHFWGSQYSNISGYWFDEPGSAGYLAATDHRGFGGGTFRLKTTGTIDSDDIGKLKGQESKFKSTSDASESMRRAFWGGGVVRNTGTDTPTQKVTIEDKSACESWVTVKASGQYPLHFMSWTGAPPNIDYEVTFVFKKMAGGQRGNKSSIEIKGWHNPFPNYEAKLMRDWAYSFSTSASGPGPFSLSGQTQIKDAKTVFFDP